MADYSTPERALQSLEDAYRLADIEAAVAARCFRAEALELLSTLESSPTDDEAVAMCAHVLELGFRKEKLEHGFPDLETLNLTVVQHEEIRPGLVKMWEEVRWPDGSVETEILHAALTRVGWRIISMPTP